ncbi:MAG: alpha/beta hydrolase [Myxococcota bacterium]|nr:alpha/beta hydrolase [Myxococcota bacterium]
MPFIELSDIRLYYELRGTGERVLVFNGSGGDLRRKPGIMDGPLPQHFETLCHDQRGLGQSDMPDIRYSMSDYANDAAALLEALGWSDCHVVGISFGGMVAQEFAIRHTEKVKRLVLACTSSGGEGGASFPLHTLPELPPEKRAQKTLELIDVRLDSDWQNENPDAAQNILGTLSAARKSESESDGSTSGLARQMEARQGHDTWDRLSQISMPVFCCGGLHDGIAPTENMRQLAEKIPNAELEFFEGGHLFLTQDPRAWKKIIQFLEGV